MSSRPKITLKMRAYIEGELFASDDLLELIIHDTIRFSLQVQVPLSHLQSRPKFSDDLSYLLAKPLLTRNQFFTPKYSS